MNRDGGNGEIVYAFDEDKTLDCCPWGQLEYDLACRIDQYDRPVELVTTFYETTVGSGPFGGLNQSINTSLLYGGTYREDMNNRGTTFRFNVNGKDESLEKLFDFPSHDTSGYQTSGGLAAVGNNSFYGAANLGGNCSFGTVYKITIS